MSKKNAKKTVATQAVPTETTPATNAGETSNAEVMVLSKRLNEKTGNTEVVTTEGIIVVSPTGEVLGTKRGRPMDPNSKRAEKLAKQAERKALFEKGELKANVRGDLRGRPSDPNSKRQQRLANGHVGTGKLGRPLDPNSARQKQINERKAKLENMKALIMESGLIPGVSVGPDVKEGDLE